MSILVLSKPLNRMNMNINNPFQINDWEIRKFLSAVLAIQLAMWGVIGLDDLGLQISILRQLIGFIYLTFIPGIIILRILKLHKLGNIETLLYSIGLSIAALMFTGLSINFVYPLSGIPGPISLFPLIITISIAVLVLCALSYIRDKEFADPAFIDLNEVLSPPVLFLCLIPFMAIFGTYLVNFQHNNILLMLMIAVIAIIALLISFDKFIPKNLYPLAVFVIALSLLYHTSLISMYLWGWDIHRELYYSNLVMDICRWDAMIPSGLNSMLSITMLAPIYSNICSMSLTWVFKIIYPLLFAFVPLGLYRVFQKQTGDKIAFLSCFFFVSLFTFYTEMLALARQQIAELFLVLLILLMINKNMDKTKRSFLLIVFSISMAVSHYGLSYIFMFCLISVLLMLVAGESQMVQRLMSGFYSKFGSKTKSTAGNPVHLKVDRTISSIFVLVFITFTIAWYIYVSSSSTFITIVEIGGQIAGSIFTEFLNPNALQGLDIIIGNTASPLNSVSKYLHLLAQFFILVGLAIMVLGRKEMKFEREYQAFALINFAICIAGIALPYFASSLNTTRLYQITLIILAPFSVIGGIAVFKMVAETVMGYWTNKCARILRGECTSSARISLPCSFEVAPVLSVFLAIFLLFNSGWAHEVAQDHPTSIALSQESFKIYGDTESKKNFYNAYIPEQDVFSARWLSKNRNTTAKVYADLTRKDNVLSSYGMMLRNPPMLSNTTTKIRKGAYIYLGYLNIVETIGTGPQLYRDFWNMIEISPLIEEKNKIYSNGCSEDWLSAD